MPCSTPNQGKLLHRIQENEMRKKYLGAVTFYTKLQILNDMFMLVSFFVGGILNSLDGKCVASVETGQEHWSFLAWNWHKSLKGSIISFSSFITRMKVYWIVISSCYLLPAWNHYQFKQGQDLAFETVTRHHTMGATYHLFNNFSPWHSYSWKISTLLQLYLLLTLPTPPGLA